ncbi:hypothetical protein BAE29_06200 [Acidithiobacillus caldus]|uniref:Uncharacterized protein n=2 Tax=Acidithiobacillus caldus TaxID=33059 RepID=A0A1E7YVJ3_9PROT|nr:hypothetical protein BAE27_03250 [Acidithiobacillus caldus]OFC38416.1 hypothetical protein BAE28_05585 [Acidithiobacillus caldus]OFC40012.1 hypothetical protein BAE29_06200 [Acidithiobacillus caldus]OFC60486.1 hypothetical protein BAE30_08075 [Acidithiobacillus caldus]
MNLLHRPDVQAVLRLLITRSRLQGQPKLELRLDDPAGHTWMGAILWNLGTIYQDYPSAIQWALFAMALGSVVTIWQIV